MRGYSRPVVDWDEHGEPFDTHEREIVVAVFDPRGQWWETTVVDGALTSLTVRKIGGGGLDKRAMTGVPFDYLRQTAMAYLERYRVAREGDEMTLADALATVDASFDGGDLRLRDDPPRLEEFAQAWREAGERHTATGRKASRRDILASRYKRTVYTIDKWIRAARDAGLIPPTGMERPDTDPRRHGAAGEKERKETMEQEREQRTDQ